MSTNPSYRAYSIALGLLAVMWLSPARMVFANECRRYLPADARPAAELKICWTNLIGEPGFYSCQDYLSETGRHRILYQGGTSPKGIIHFGWDVKHAQLVWSFYSSGVGLTCVVTPPLGLPGTAVHRGTGVCQDADDKPVPCSVFEHAAARQNEVRRYMVFYDPDGNGPTSVDDQMAGWNPDAMVAELAFQIGLGLLDTECCRALGQAYLAFVYELFPNADVYRETYDRLDTGAAPRTGNTKH